MSDRFIYFDNINTAFPIPEAIAASQIVLTGHLGNPSSHIHSAGIVAGQILDKARKEVAAFINAQPEEITFTSGATESNNLAITGYLKANANQQLVISSIDHFSILNQAKRLKVNGSKVTIIDVDSTGLISLDQLENAVTSMPSLVSVAFANPEIGTIQHIEKIGAICKKNNATFHSDAAAAAPFLPIDVMKMNISLLTLSGHNLYSPMGVGALFARREIKISPLFEGGNQESGLRPGTENISGIAAMGEACNIVAKYQADWNENFGKLGKRLWNGLARGVPFIHFTGHEVNRLPGHVSFWVEHIEGESLLLLLNMKGIMAASGSACSSNMKGRDEADLAASHVLTAVGVPTDICAGSITFSLANYNTEDEVDYVITVMPELVQKLLSMSPSYSDYKKKELMNG